MNKKDNKKLLLPKTAFGWASVLYFCVIWWFLNNKPVMQIFNNMVNGDNIVWLFGMPITFTYVIAASLLTIVWTVLVLKKWEVDDQDE